MALTYVEHTILMDAIRHGQVEVVQRWIEDKNPLIFSILTAIHL
jgi:hypothetical protein